MNCLDLPPPPNIAQFMSVMNMIHRLSTQLCSDRVFREMTIAQMAAVGFLLHQEEEGADAYQQDLASIFNLRRSTISSLVDTLEEKGIAQRVSVPHDARLKKLVLTEKGRQTAKEVKEVFQDVHKIIFQGISYEELVVTKTVLNKVEQNLIRAAY